MSKTENTIEDLLKKQQNENRLLHEENDKFQKSIDELNYECYKLENILEKNKGINDMNKAQQILFKSLEIFGKVAK